MNHTCTALLTLAAIAAAHSQPGPSPWTNVRDFGAVGDGTIDDTQAFQNALNACAPSGGVAMVPAGHYLIGGSLTIPASVALEGMWCAPATVDRYVDPDSPEGHPKLSGSVILATGGKGDENGAPLFQLSTNATLKGVTIFYPEQTKTNPPIPYPWAVQSAGADNPSVVDVLMVNPYQAVDFGSKTAGRHYIRNLYVQALRRGVYVDLCLDIGRLENIHIWPFWTAADQDSPVTQFMLEEGEAFIFGRADWEYVSNCFAIGYKTGFRFVRSAGTGPFEGGGNYLLTQSGADMCRTAVLVEEAQGHSGISFSNSQMFGDIVVSETNNAMVRFTGCGMFGSIDGARGTALARIAGTGRVSFGNCHFYCIHPESRNAEAMIVVESGRIGIDNCVFINSRNTAGVNSNPIPIVLRPDVRSAIITDNEFYGEMRIVNEAKGRTVIENNLERTDEDPFPEAQP